MLKSEIEQNIKLKKMKEKTKQTRVNLLNRG
jgi:hypothetical protein